VLGEGIGDAAEDVFVDDNIGDVPAEGVFDVDAAICSTLNISGGN